MTNLPIVGRQMSALLTNILDELQPLMNQHPPINRNYMIEQRFSEINLNFRETIIDWICGVCEKKELPVPVLIRSVFLFDAYCSIIQRPDDIREAVKQYSTILALCVDIAAKVEGKAIFKSIPENFGITVSDLFEFELKILESLDYKTCFFGADQMAEIFIGYLYKNNKSNFSTQQYQIQIILNQVERAMVELQRKHIYQSPADLAADAIQIVIGHQRLAKGVKRSFSTLCSELNIVPSVKSSI